MWSGLNLQKACLFNCGCCFWIEQVIFTQREQGYDFILIMNYLGYGQSTGKSH